MKNKTFKKKWYQIDPFDKMLENYNSKNRYSRRHSLSILKIADGQVIYKMK